MKVVTCYANSIARGLAVAIALLILGCLSGPVCATENGVNVNTPPINHSLTPSAVSLGTEPVTISALYSDFDGYLTIRKMYLLINDSLGQANAALIVYDRLENRVYLKNDANNSWGIGYAPGVPVTIENSQCKVLLNETSVAGSGVKFTVNWRVQLKNPFSTKALNGYMYIQDGGGLHDGWDLKAIYHNVKPEVVSVAPDDYIYVDPPESQIFSSVYKDVNGADDIRKCYFLINDTLTMTNAIFLCYDATTNKIYLKNDANTSWGVGQTPGAAMGLWNTQCNVFVDRSWVTKAGTDLTVNWAISALSPFATKNLYGWMYVNDSAGANSGYRKVGAFFTPIAPVCLSLSPNSGTVVAGVENPFMALYSDDNGWPDIYRIYIQLSVTSSQADAALLMYDAKVNKVFLRNDANTSWGAGGTPGSATVLENNQCRVNMASMGPTPWNVTDDQLQVSWPIEIKPSLLGKKLCERVYVVDNENLSSSWKVKGYVTVVP